MRRRGSGVQAEQQVLPGHQGCVSAAVLLTLQHDPEQTGQAMLGNLVLQVPPLALTRTVCIPKVNLASILHVITILYVQITAVGFMHAKLCNS